jgi:hypothetical protein
MTDQQIWMVGVLSTYFMKKVLHFSHDDFLTSLSADLGPLLGETGLWALKNYENSMSEEGNEEEKRRARVA